MPKKFISFYEEDGRELHLATSLVLEDFPRELKNGCIYLPLPLKPLDGRTIGELHSSYKFILVIVDDDFPV